MRRPRRRIGSSFSSETLPLSPHFWRFIKGEHVRAAALVKANDHDRKINVISIYTLSDLGVLSNLIGSLSLANEHYSPPTE